MNVYEIARDWAEEPVTVVAETLEDAQRIYREWIEKHHEDHSAEPVMIYPFVGAALKARPRFALLAKQGVSGIAYWSRTASRWVVGAPWGTPLIELVEPEPLVSYFRFEADLGFDAMVFAETYEEATTLYCAFQLDRWGELPSMFWVRKMTRWDLRGEMAVLRDDMEANISGIGRCDVEGNWRILPPDYEPSYGRT